MKNTKTIQAIIRSALDRKGLKNVDLTRHLGKPKNWATKLFNGTIKNISDEDADQICDFLNTSFLEVTENGRHVSSLAVRLSALMEHNENLARAVALLVDIIDDKKQKSLTSLPPKRLMAVA